MIPASLPDALATFGRQPSLHAAPAAMASLLGHGISVGLVERMLGASSIRERLDRALLERLGAAPDQLTPAQACVAALDEAGLTHLALRAGAVWHAATIARVYEGEAVRALVERIGPEFRATALADLPTPDSLSRPQPPFPCSMGDRRLSPGTAPPAWSPGARSSPDPSAGASCCACASAAGRSPAMPNMGLPSSSGSPSPTGRRRHEPFPAPAGHPRP